VVNNRDQNKGSWDSKNKKRKKIRRKKGRNERRRKQEGNRGRKTEKGESDQYKSSGRRMGDLE